MKRKTHSWLAPALWIFSAVVWAAAFFRNISFGPPSAGLAVAQGCAGLGSLAAAISCFLRPGREKKIRKEQ